MGEEETKSNISNFEWFLVMGAVGMMDLVQLGVTALDFTVVLTLLGIIANVLIDIAVGYSLFMYCLMRGIKLTPTRVLILLGGFLLEWIPVIGGAPLWTLDVVLIMLSVKAEEGQLGGGAAAPGAGGAGGGDGGRGAAKRR